MSIVTDSVPAEQQLRALMAASLHAKRAERWHQLGCRARERGERCATCLAHERAWLEAEVAVERFLSGDES